jgi:hypothetical protein
MEQLHGLTEDGRREWAAFMAALMRAARDVGTLALLNEPVLADLAPEHEPARWVVTLLPSEGVARCYLSLAAADGEPRRMAHAGDLHADGTWRTGTQPITPKGPAH